MAGTSETVADDEEELDARPRGTILRVVLLVIAAIALILVLIWLLSGGGTEFFRGKIDVYTFISDSGGIEPGAYVALNGVKVGRVQEVLLSHSTNAARVVRINMELQERFLSSIPTDSIAAITADNILGDKYMNIVAGKGNRSVGNGSEIASLIQTGNFNPGDLVASLQSSLQRVDAILTEIQAGDSPIAQFVRGDSFYKDLYSQLNDLRQKMSDYTGPNTQLGQALFDTAIYDQIRQPILNLDVALDQIQRGENPAGRFITTDAAYTGALTQVRNIHQSIADTRAGKGTVGTLLTSDQQYEELRAQVESINQSVENLTLGDGAFARMLRSSDFYDSLAGPSGRARAFLKDFRQDPRKFLRIKVF